MADLDRPSFLVPLEPPAQIAPARDSATVIVARDAGSRLEVFMLERHLNSDFAGGAYVFPGGTVDEPDRDPRLADLIDGFGRSLMDDMGEQDETLARALVVCAIRETFEESGILLARNADGSPVALRGDERWADLRRALAAREVTALELAQRTGIRYAADRLRFWARWATPEFAPKRYDARFFVAHMPEGQEPLHDDVETTASRWIAPEDALEQGRAGTFSIIFPTRKTLEELASMPSAHDVFDAAVGRPNHLILPKIVFEGGEPFVVMPGDATLHAP